MSPSFKPMGDESAPEPTHLSREALRALMGWLRPYRGAILLNVLLTVVLGSVELSVPKMLKWLIDGLVMARHTVPAAPVARQAELLANAWAEAGWLLVVFVGLFAATVLLHRVEMRRVVMLGQRFMCAMRKRFFDHLHALGLTYYDRMKAGQLIARGTSDMDALEHVVAWAPSQLVTSGLMLVGVTVLMAQEDWRLFLALFPILATQAVLTHHLRVKASATWRRVRKQSGRLTANLAESIAGARVIQAFAREQQCLTAFNDLADDLYVTRLETARIMARYMAATHVLTTGATVMVLGLGGWRVVQGALSPGGVAAYLGYVVMFFRPIEMVSELYNMLLHALAGAERILEVLKTAPAIVDRAGACDPDDVEGGVTLDHVSFEYAADVPVLRDVSLAVRPGETVALVGPTGAGKTTICRLIARFYEVSEGAVRIDGTDVRDMTQLGLHRHMGIVLQENFLFSGTVLENIRYGRPAAPDAEVLECARRVGSHRAIEALPAGYATLVGERGESLSAGQRQLICYTRAMMAAPRILILDEATSAVDTGTEMALQAALRRLTERRTCFIVAHRLSTVRDADRVIVIEAGRITEQGPHAELVAAGGRYAAMYEAFIQAE